MFNGVLVTFLVDNQVFNWGPVEIGWLMGIPVLASRSGFTAWGVEIAQQVGLTLIGRMRGKRFTCLSGAERLVWDADPTTAEDEDPRHRRKSARA